MFWLVLHSGRVQRLPEGGYKKTKEAGGHVERLLKGSKHPLHNPTTATIPTTEDETHTKIEILETLNCHSENIHIHKNTATLKFK